MFEYRQANLLTAEKELCATDKKKRKKTLESHYLMVVRMKRPVVVI